MSKRREAYDAIRDRILRREEPFLSSDERTSERVIAEQYVGMSRTPVREALAVLTSTGIVNQIPQSGVEVRDVNSDEAIQALRLRAGMESVIVEEIASHALGGGDELRQSLDRLETLCGDEDQVGFMLEDTTFHVNLARLGGFHTSLTTLQGLRDRVHLFRLKQPLTEADMHAVITEHATLIDALASHDPVAAPDALRAHIDSTRARIEGAAASEKAESPDLVGAGSR
jgi:DNA-binding GntR family transcriptional regulator